MTSLRTCGLYRAVAIAWAVGALLGPAGASFASLPAASRCVAIGPAAGCGALALRLDGAAAVHQKAQQFAAALGPALDPAPRAVEGGFAQRFQFGSVYWTPDLGAFEVHGLIYAAYAVAQEERGALGFPISDETVLPGGGSFSVFENGAIFFHPDPTIGTHLVLGAVFAKWFDLALEGKFLAYPTSLIVRDGIVANDFQNGAIYWSESTGAHEVHGDILAKWDQIQREASSIGLPTSDELDLGQGGKVSEFQNGAIVSSAKGTFVLEGDIYRHWDALTNPTVALGFPTGDVEAASGGGHKLRFQSGAIYTDPRGRTFEVHGRIYDKWRELDLEAGLLGYPRSDELADAASGGRVSHFENGSIHFAFDATPFSVYTQNMAMLTSPAPYLGFDKGEALAALKDFLLDEQPDFVGLQEMFDEDIANQLVTDPDIVALYRQFGGPGPLPGDFDIARGGLLILSHARLLSYDEQRFPIASDAFVAAVPPVTADPFAAKGVIHTRARLDSGRELDFFVSHTQDQNAEGKDASRGTTVAQLDTIRSFIASHRGLRERPAILVGDLNLNGNNSSDYTDLIRGLGGPIDTWRFVHPGAPGEPTCGPVNAPSDRCGITSDNVELFDAGTVRVRQILPRGTGGTRLDYILEYPGITTRSVIASSRVITQSTVTEFDMSDHFGVMTTYSGQETLDVDYTGPIGQVYVRLHGFHAIFPTRGTLPTGVSDELEIERGEDEVDWDLELFIDGRRLGGARARVEGIGRNDTFFFDPVNGPQILGGSVEDEIEIRVTAEEFDSIDVVGGESGRVRIGRESIVLTRSQLFEALRAPGYYTLPIMRGDRSAYAVTISVSASTDPAEFPIVIRNPEGPQIN